LALKAPLLIECHVAFEHVIDGTGQRMGQHGRGFTFVMRFFQAGEVLLRWRMVSQQQDSGFRKGPFEISIADLRAGGAIPLPRGCLGACDQAALGHKLLNPREAGDSMDLVEQDQMQNLANAGDGLE
jgi:hypothetical protein